jgi:excinuclease ABC subunit C
VEAFLTGRSAEILRTVQKEMEEAAENLAFEQAAKLRDLLKAMRRTVEGQATVLTRLVDMDVVNMAATEHGVGLCVLFVRQGRLLDRKTFFFPGVEAAEADAVAVTALVQFYRPGSFIAPRVVVPATLAPVAIGASGPPDPVRPGEAGMQAPTGEAEHRDGEGGDSGQSDAEGDRSQGEGAGPGAAADDAAAYGAGGQSGGAEQREEGIDPAAAVTGPGSEEGGEEGGGDGQALAEILAERRGAGVRLGPPRGREERQLLEMAAVNARRAAEEAAKAAESDILPALARKFGLPALSRIEAVDVSHLGGKGVRVGMVVFEDGTPRKSDYRAYAFPELEGTSDDYLALATFAAKRAASGPPWPDLLLIDGGKGQLEAVSRSLTEAGVARAFALASIAKGERRSQNEMDDVIYVPGRKNPLSLRSGSPELLFLQRVRDTVHDFSIGRQRRARNTASLQSTVLELPGVGPKTARLLWEAFGSVTAMRAAGAGEIMAKTGLGPRRAAAVAAALAALAD